MRDRHTARRVVVGTDGSPNSRSAATWAIENSQPGDTILLLHVWHPYVYGNELGAALTIDESVPTELIDGEFRFFLPLAKEHQVMLKHALVQGEARVELRDTDSDLIVIGAKGHTGLSGLILGSVASYVAAHSKVPVVIVPQHD
ncbi:MAG: universal stress protein [Actinobacteria bacterium]|jgi:nucleotide-binding universal stress UspA family protein|nr:universal stress protein [Actinomycetota bacterium]